MPWLLAYKTSPELCLDKYISRIHSTVSDGPANLLLIVVNTGSVQTSVAGLDGGQDGLVTLLALHLVRPKLNHRHLLARTEAEGLAATVKLQSLPIRNVFRVLTDKTPLNVVFATKFRTFHD